MIFKICAYAIMAIVIITLVKELGWRGAPLIAVGALIFAIGLILPLLTRAKGYYNSFASSLGISDIAITVLKIVGIGYIAGIVCELCREMGEGLIARSVALVGRIEIIMMSAPYFLEVVKLGVSLI